MKKKSKLVLTGMLMSALTFSVKAQDWGCTEDTRDSILENVSIYQSDMKLFKESKDIRYLEEAYPHWKVVVTKCPKQSKNLYVNGEGIIRLMLSKETDTYKRKELIEALSTMYDIRMKAYPQERDVILEEKNNTIKQYSNNSNSSSDWEFEYPQLIKEQLLKRNCDAAESFYDIYKILVRHTNHDIEQCIAACKNGLTCVQDETSTDRIIEKLDKEVEAEEIVIIPDVEPSFPGGDDSLYAYLAENIKYPEVARDSRIVGKVYVQFVVERNGSITNVAVKKDIGGGCGEEAERVVLSMPRWKPGKVGGRTVRSQFVLPINFILK